MTALPTSILQVAGVDPATRADPDPPLRALREHCPAMRDAALHTVFTTRYAEAKQVTADRTLWRSPFRAHRQALVARQNADAEARQPIPSMLVTDDPDHGRIRQAFAKALIPRVAATKGSIEALVGEVLDRLGRPPRFELMEAVAIPVPILAIGRILGIEDAKLADFRRWSEALVQGLNPVRTPAQTARLDEAIAALDRYFGELMAARRVDPRDDLITDMVRLQAEGAELSDHELKVNFRLLLAAGNVTTSDLIGVGVKTLLENPDQLAAFRADPERLAPALVEELLRFEPPVGATLRVAPDARAIAGTTTEPADAIMVSLRAANRDPAVYPDPDRFDIGRKRPPHFAFGGGAHLCLGASLARIEGAAVFAQLFARFPDLRLPEQALEWRMLPFFRGLERLWVETGA